MQVLTSRILLWLLLIVCLRCFAMADSIQPNSKTDGSIGFFCPELVHYRQQLRDAKLQVNSKDLTAYLNAVATQTRELAANETSLEQNTKKLSLLRAALWIIAADSVPQLSEPILDVLRVIDEPKVRIAGQYALAATLDEAGATRLQKELESSSSSTLQLTCVRVLRRVKQPELEMLVAKLATEDLSDEVKLAVTIGLAENGQAAALDSLVTLLLSSDLGVRHRTARVLRSWTGQDFGFGSYRSRRDQRMAILKYRKWLTTFDRSTLKPFQLPVHSSRVLVVRGKVLLELGHDGSINHQQAGFNSLSEAIGLEGGHRLVTDFHGRERIEFDENWNEVQRKRVPFQPRGSHRMPKGQTLVIGMSHIQVIDANGATADPLQFPGTTNFTGSKVTGDERFLVTCNDQQTLQEFNLSGKKLWELKVENHPRSIQVLDNGQLLVADFRQAAIYSPDGTVEWRYPHSVYSANQLPSGNILLTDKSGLYVIDLDGEKLWEMKQPEHQGHYFFANLE